MVSDIERRGELIAEVRERDTSQSVVSAAALLLDMLVRERDEHFDSKQLAALSQALVLLEGVESEIEGFTT